MNATSSAVLEAAVPASPPVARVEPARRFYELDLLRFLAAFSVMLFHYSFRGWAADRLSPIVYQSLAPVTKYGGLGVNLFFLISGFVILMSAGQGSARTFVISRVVRLYPAFWVCCTVTFVALRLAPHPRFVPTVGSYLENLTMLNGFVGENFIDSVYWSLTVEMQFYFMVFLALKLRLIGRAKEILGIWLAAYAACALLHIRYLPILLIPSYAPYFVGGAMFFLIAREGVSPYKLAVVGASFALAAWQSVPAMEAMRAHYHVAFSNTVTVLTLAAFYGLFFLVATGRTRALASKRFLTLGALTYPLYLIHQNIGFAIFNSAWPRLGAGLILGGTVAIMLAAAYLVTRIEKATAPRLKALLTRLSAPRPS